MYQHRKYGSHCNWNLLFQRSAHFLNTLMQQVTIVFIYQRDLYYFPENQRFKNKMIDYAHHCHHCNCVQEFSLCRLLANGYWLDGVSLVGRINWGGGGGFGYLNHPRLIEFNIEKECYQLSNCRFFLPKFLLFITFKENK